VDGDTEYIRWSKVANVMNNPRLIFDGHNFLAPAIESLGYTLHGIGTPDKILDQTCENGHQMVYH
jgi:hypothetical protein